MHDGGRIGVIASHKVLVIGDDTRSCLSTVRSLGRRGIEVHAAPFNFRAPALTSRYVSKVHRLPYYSGDGARWLKVMLRLLKRERFALVIACDERSLLPLDRHRVHVLLFGTRLTPVTRHLKHRDVDVALARVAGAVTDWSGGTRIGACLGEFNRRWSRRLLGQNAIVLLISDGLDADAGEGLAFEAERLAKSCRRLVWLNPLLRYEGFEAKPAGIRALLPWVDDFRPVHNLASLAALAGALSSGRAPRVGRARGPRNVTPRRA